MERKQVILIVDDTPENLRVLGNLLEVEYEVRIATNGQDALDSVKESAPDLILLDILMPGMDGYEVCHKLKDNPEFKMIPIIFISALGMSEQKVEAFREGAVDYITKPFQSDEVIARVRTHLQLSKLEELKHEIAERKRAEELLKQQNKALDAQREEYRKLNKQLQENNADLIIAKEHSEESDRLKSAFLANMSHEIRTPMNGILGFANLLKEHDLSNESQQTYIDIIEKSGTRMLNIINDIVDISKIESGQTEVHLNETNINVIVEYIYTFFKPEVENKGLSFNFKNSLQTNEAFIMTDREKIYAILTNLVKNAIKYTNIGAIEFGYDKTGDFLEFYVKDTGVGIPKDRQEAIFERFIQADIADVHALQGSGLGLTITKAYVELLGGEIWLKSEEGNGSIFYFTIPSTIKSEEKGVKIEFVAENENNNNVQNLKILIAEDDVISEMLITIAVKEFCSEVLKARTGIEAVEICRNNPDLDLIMMDIKMPELNGYDATRQIRQFNKDVIIIAQTAFALSYDRHRAIEIGCNDYITKPINKVELLALIQKYIKK